MNPNIIPIPQFDPSIGSNPAIGGPSGGGGYGVANAAGLAFGTAALAGIQAFENNRAIEGTLNNLALASSVNIGQINEAEQLELFKERQNLRRTLGRVAVAFAGAGGASASDFRRQAVGDNAVNTYVVEENARNQRRAERSQFEAQAARIRSQWQSPVLAAVQAGVGGFASGVGLFAGLNQLSALQGVSGS
jgi:hypothetical protein